MPTPRSRLTRQLLFFYLYGVITLLALFLDSGIIPTSSPTYPVRDKTETEPAHAPQWFAAVYTAFVAAMFWCLLVNGFVGFQFAEDGTPLSLWVRQRERSTALTRSSFGCRRSRYGASSSSSRSRHSSRSPALRPTRRSGYGSSCCACAIRSRGAKAASVFNGICALVYIVLQLVLVLRTLDDRWPIGDILFGTAFFAVALVITFAFSVTMCVAARARASLTRASCDAVKHYLDGLLCVRVLEADCPGRLDCSLPSH